MVLLPLFHQCTRKFLGGKFGKSVALYRAISQEEPRVMSRKVKKYKGEFTIEIKPAPFVRGFNENGFEVLRLEEKWDEI